MMVPAGRAGRHWPWQGGGMNPLPPATQRHRALIGLMGTLASIAWLWSHAPPPL